MAGIYHPSRGGVRGGKDQFNWEDVKTDKERENYLGHSLMVPVGKWQEGKDLIWYTRDKNEQEKIKAEKKKREEIQSVKDLEARAMAAALGHKTYSDDVTGMTAKELQEVLSCGKSSTSNKDHTEIKDRKSQKKKKEKKKKKKHKQRKDCSSSGSEEIERDRHSETRRHTYHNASREEGDTDRLYDKSYGSRRMEDETKYKPQYRDRSPEQTSHRRDDSHRNRAYDKYSAEEKTELNRSSKKIDFNKDRTPRDSKYSQRTDDRTSNNRSLTKYKYKIKSEKPEKRKQRHYSSSSND